MIFGGQGFHLECRQAAHFCRGERRYWLEVGGWRVSLGRGEGGGGRGEGGGGGGRGEGEGGGGRGEGEWRERGAESVTPVGRVAVVYQTFAASIRTIILSMRHHK